MEGLPGGDGEAAPAEPVLAPGARISDDELEMLLSPDKDLLCSITGELFEDPVVTEDGHTYERTAIEEWFHSQKMAGRPVTSPLTNVKLKHARAWTATFSLCRRFGILRPLRAQRDSSVAVPGARVTCQISMSSAR